LNLPKPWIEGVLALIAVATFAVGAGKYLLGAPTNEWLFNVLAAIFFALCVI
jgi:hypothetical protein